jgi:predicted MFS family arabinose efflux permease
MAFYLVWAGLGICSAAVLYEPAFAVVAIWFVRRRSQALALVTLAAGLASTIFIPLSDTLRQMYGWRDTLVILALFLAVTTIPLHAFVLRRRPGDLGLLPDGGVRSDLVPTRPSGPATLNDILRSRTFWLLVAGFSLSNLAADAIRVHFIPFLVDTGIEAGTAAWASGSIGVMQVIGRVFFAPLDTRLSNRAMLAGIFGLQALALPLLLLGSSVGLVSLFIAVFGAVYGARTLARASTLACRYGPSFYGRISSVMAVFLTLARTAAPVGAGLLYDHFGSYQPVLWGAVAISLISFGIALLVRPESVEMALL